MKRPLFFLALLACSFLAIPAEAHESRPIFVRVTEAEAGVFDLYWKIPVTAPANAVPVMPEGCVAEGGPVVQNHADAFVGQQRYRCAAALSGQALGMQFPGINPSLSTLFQVTLLGGERHAYILKPGKAAWTVPQGESILQTEFGGIMIPMYSVPPRRPRQAPNPPGTFALRPPFPDRIHRRLSFCKS